MRVVLQLAQMFHMPAPGVWLCMTSGSDEALIVCHATCLPIYYQFNAASTNEQKTGVLCQMSFSSLNDHSPQAH
jgi:hypothetical protein